MDVSKFYFISGSILQGVSKEDKKILLDTMIVRREPKGKTLFKESSYPKGVYFLRKGRVKIFQLNADGKEQIIYFYTKGDSFGFRPLICNQLHPVTAKTISECTLSFIPKESFLKVLLSSNSLANVLLKNLSFEFSVWVNTTALFSQKPIKEKTAIALLILSNKFKIGVGKSLSLTISRDDLASYIGTTTETVVRILRIFKDEKIIKTKGRKILFINSRKLKQQYLH